MYADPNLRIQLLELGIDLDQIPMLLRKAQIVTDPGKPPGLLPIPTATFNKNVADGLIEKPVNVGARARAWRRHAIVKILIADSGGSRPGFRDDLAHHSDLMSLGVPR